MKKCQLLFVFILLVSVEVIAQEAFFSASPLKREVRGVWLTTLNGLDWPRCIGEKAQKAELCRQLDSLRRAGINTVFLQSRIRATVIYQNAEEPWDACMTRHPGKNPGYDPLAFCIEACHQRGMELHAWVVTVPVGKWNSEGCKWMRKHHPRLVRRIGDSGFMNVEAEGTARYLASICRDIAQRYDVDGIHLDYIRYPETWHRRVSATEGRSRITAIVREIHRQVKAVKPWVRLSCAPIGKHDDLPRVSSRGWNARKAVCQDAQQWLSEGLMDWLVPMMYFRDGQFFPFAIDWQEQSSGRVVSPGLGIYFLDPKEGSWTLGDISRQLSVLRSQGMGFVLFRSKFLLDNAKGVYDLVCSHNSTLALTPALENSGTQTGTTPVISPSSLRLTGNRLEWNRSGNDTLLYYNVYASKHFPVDVADGSNLVAVRLRGSSLMVPADARVNYAVCAMNRWGVESDATQLQLVESEEPYQYLFWRTADIINTDGRWLRLPPGPSWRDAEYIIIETLTGQQLFVAPLCERPIDISRLLPGVYALRSLGRKGRNHRIGYFKISPFAQ